MNHRYPDHEHNNVDIDGVMVPLCVDCYSTFHGTPAGIEYDLCLEWDGWGIGTSDEEPYFSMSPCEGCHSTLGGNRYRVSAFHITCVGTSWCNLAESGAAWQ
jgi:hypothetical protein